MFHRKEIKNMKLINATPHAINIIGANNEVLLTVEPSGILVRVSQETTDAGVLSVNGVQIPLTDNTLGDVVGLHPQQADTIIIVSALVASACKRADLALVNEAVRDAKGRIIGCRSLSLPNKEGDM